MYKVEIWCRLPTKELISPVQTKQENVYSAALHKCPYVLMSSPRKQRLRSSPAHSWTPTMPKMKKTKKQRRRTFPSMGRVSNSRVTKIRIPSGAKNKQGYQKWLNFTIFCAQNKSRCFKLTCVTIEFCISCIGQPLTGPQVKTQSDNLYWSRELGTDHFGPTVNIITSDDNTPSDSFTLLFPVGFNLTTPPLAGIIKPRAVSGVRDRLPEVCTMCSDPFRFCRSLVTPTLLNDDN